eukprot:COSAG02_NODE_11951_length_1626_cov_1.146693_1_plen_45_part_10
MTPGIRLTQSLARLAPLVAISPISTVSTAISTISTAISTAISMIS